MMEALSLLINFEDLIGVVPVDFQRLSLLTMVMCQVSGHGMIQAG